MADPTITAKSNAIPSAQAGQANPSQPYKIQAGDNPTKIAAAFLEELQGYKPNSDEVKDFYYGRNRFEGNGFKQLNQGLHKNASRLKIGSTYQINLPNVEKHTGDSHLIKDGETLSGICKKTYGKANSQIYEQVRAQNPGVVNENYGIRAGKTLRLPKLQQPETAVPQEFKDGKGKGKVAGDVAANLQGAKLEPGAAVASYAQLLAGNREIHQEKKVGDGETAKQPEKSPPEKGVAADEVQVPKDNGDKLQALKDKAFAAEKAPVLKDGVAADEVQPLKDTKVVAEQAGPIKTVDQANAYAQSRLKTAFADQGLDINEFDVSVQFPRSTWKKEDFEDQEQLKQSVDAAAGFLSQLTENIGDAARLDVNLVPDGKMQMAFGSKTDALYVPADKDMNELELREAYDKGSFLSKMKDRVVWKRLGSPASMTRTRIRQAIEQVSTRVSSGIDKLSKSEGSKGLKQSVIDLAKGFAPSDEKLRDSLLNRLSKANDSQLRDFLKNWKSQINDGGRKLDVERSVPGMMGAKITDTSVNISLLGPNVSTYDAHTVSTDDILKKHGDKAIGEVKIDSVNFSLLGGNIKSTDVVTVVPNLARMIFGGSTMERALNDSGL